MRRRRTIYYMYNLLKDDQRSWGLFGSSNSAEVNQIETHHVENHFGIILTEFNIFNFLDTIIYIFNII